MLGQLGSNLQPSSPLTPSRVQFVAELTGQASSFDTTHAAHPYCPSATAYSCAPLPTPLTQRTPKLSQHAAILSPEPFAGLPIGDKGAFAPLTVSAPNRPEGDNLLQNSDSLSAAPMPMPVAGFARHGPPDVGHYADLPGFSYETRLTHRPDVSQRVRLKNANLC